MMQEYHAPQSQPEPQSGVRLPTTTLLDAVVPAVCFLLTWGLFSSILTFGGPSAWTAVCYAGLFALATVYLAAKQRRFRPAALLPGVCALAVCSGFLLHNDSSDFTLLAFLLLIPLSGFCCLSLTGANLHPFGSFYVLLDLLHCELLLPLKHLLLPLRALSESRRAKKKNRGVPAKRRILLPVLLGVLAALPLLFWAVSLLIDADAAFESVLGTAFDALHRFAEAIVNRLPDYFEPFALFLAVLFTPYIFSVMFSFAHGVAKTENRDTSARWTRLQKLSPAFVITVLAVLSAAYVLYLLTQAGYLFAAFSGHLPGGSTISVTDYARRGFFELCKLGGLNFVLIALSVGVTKRNSGKLPAPVKALGTFLCAFTMLLCAVSMAKILLYIGAYGLTEKRLYVFMADIVLLLCFAAVLLRLWIRKFPYLQVMLAAVCVSMVVLSVCGVGNTIAWYNTHALLTGKAAHLTVQDLRAESGSAALPYLQRLAASDSPYADDAKRELAARQAEISFGTEAPFYNAEQYRMVQWLRQESDKANSFTIEVTFDTDTPVYGLDYALTLGEKTVLGGGCMNADGKSPLEKTVTLEVFRRELPQNADLSAIDLKLSVLLTPEDANGQAKTQTVTFYDSAKDFWNVAFGGQYGVMVSDDGDGGFLGYCYT